MNHQKHLLLRTSTVTLIIALLITTPAPAQLFTLNRTFDDPTVTRDGFGFSVAVDYNHLLIGAPWDDTNGANVGQAHLFDTSGTLLHTFDDPTINEGDGFGRSIALDGNRVFIGDPRDYTNGELVGQAHLFDAMTGNWVQTFDDPTPSTLDADAFGTSVAVDGDRVLVGARGNSNAYLFDTSGTLLQAFDDPTVTYESDNFGASVALDGDRVLVGAPSDKTNAFRAGQAHLFDTSGNLLHTFDDPVISAEDGFGASVALEGNRVLIGAPGDDTLGQGVGQAHLFDTSGNLLQTFNDPTPTPGGCCPDAFGASVALDGDRVLVGAPSDNTNGEATGQAHLFDTSGTLLHTFDNPSPASYDWFGHSVALHGNRILIGAHGDDTMGDAVGQAYLFTPTCDFNSDAECDIEDLNTMLAEGPIAPGVTVSPGVNDQYDLTGNGVIDNADVDQWLADAAAIDGFGSPYKGADANLDGVVDGEDFLRWNVSKFTSSLLWDNGDFNGDGVVDGQDFILWNENKFTSPDGLSAIPEPATDIMAVVAILLIGRLGYGGEGKIPINSHVLAMAA